ncbi:hemerythrin domain-containing protein [Allorhizocola rhizosphaerae]|uniref:hemerythrin domain-containing protein n=1 Tax=Allorhizocola rhizosphaerae TaxID=1872709 RepID=UPI000E3B9D75|nr:hemerythrin domain-containing protein [Allorhizocola rhizosphaerae]
MRAATTVVRQKDLIDVLLEQHALIEELFQLVETSRGKAKKEAFTELAALLQAHEEAEAEIVHPLAAATIDAGIEVTQERLEEEAEAKELLAQLIKSGPGSAAFDDDFQQLRASVLEHAVHEERYEFKHLRASQPPETLVELADKFLKRQKRLAATA